MALMSRRGARPVIAVGTAPLLAQAADALAAEGVALRRFSRPPNGRPPAGLMRRARLLLLCEGQDLDAQLDWARRATRGRDQALRTVVLRAAEYLPGPVSDAEAQSGPDASSDTLRVEWVDPYHSAARALFRRWPLHSGFDPPWGADAHLLLAGFGPMARAAFLHALRVGQYADRPPLLTLAADDTALWRDWIAMHHPQAEVCGQLRFATLPADAAPDQAPPVTTVLVCDLPAPRALALARGLRDAAAARGDSPLVLLAADGAWPEAPLSAWDGQLVPVQPLGLALSRAVLLEERDDVLAAVIHEHYRDTSSAQGRDPAAAPSGRPWPALAASYRNANRHQADHLWAKLAVTDCRAVPEELVESFAFSPAEIETLAIIEHRRWSVERWLDGWRYGAERDNARKRHPQLIPYPELSDAMQDLDRFAARLVPSLLARSGLGILRRLIVAVAAVDQPRAAPLGRAGFSVRAVQGVLERLVQRYPDRGLTLALDPSDAHARAVAIQAVARHGAGLFLLLPCAISRLLQQETDAGRQDVLQLLALAERRIPLRGEHAVADWIAARAEIQWQLGGAHDAMRAEGESPLKRVYLDARGTAHWGFAY
jgi:hypothetical protein